MTSMRVILDSADRQFLKELHQIGHATIQEICSAAGVTATAVRQRLSRLQSLGMVSRELVRHGRGRPYHAYHVTDKGLRELGDNYSDLAQILWAELQQIREPSVRRGVAGRIEDAFVEQFGKGVDAASLRGRVEQLRGALAERGFDVEVDTSGGLPILRENNCPYQELADSDPTICELEQAVFERVLGAPVTLTNCCRDGYHCCEFQAGTSE